MIVGQNIRRLRYERGLKLRELAEKSGVAVSTLCELEKGTTVTGRYETLERVAKALGVTIADLWRETA